MCKLSFFSMGPGNILRKDISSAKRIQGRNREEESEPDSVYNLYAKQHVAFMQPEVQYQEITPRLVSWQTSPSLVERTVNLCTSAWGRT